MGSTRARPEGAVAAGSGATTWCREALEQLPDAVIVTDASHHVTFLNAVARQRYGERADSAVGRPLAQLYTAQWRHPGEEAAAWAELERTGRWRGETIHLGADGRQHEVESTVGVLRDANGARLGLLAVVRDVDERKRAERLSAFLSTLSKGHIDQQGPGELTRTVLSMLLVDFELAAASWTSPGSAGLEQLEYEPRDGSPNLREAKLERFFSAERRELGTPLVVPDVATAPGTAAEAEQLRALGVSAFVLAPGPGGGRQGSLLTLTCARPRLWLESEVVFFRDAAMHLAAAHERMRAIQALRQSEERLRKIYENAPVGIAIADLSGRLVEGNPALAGMLGQPEAELRGRAFADFIHPDDREKDLGLVGSLRRGERAAFEVESRYCRRDGRVVWAQKYVSVLRDERGAPEFLVALALDVTTRHETEQALRRTLDTMEARIKERTAELQRRADQLGRLASELTLVEQRSRKQLSSVLHDQVQQLLASAKLHVSLLGQERGDRAQALERALRCLDEALAATRTLSVELSPPLLHEFGLAPAFEWLGEWMREKHRLELHVTTDPLAAADSDEIRTLLFESVRELLFNAAKHAGVSEAWLDLSLPDPEHLRVTVSDRGRGFDPSHLGPPNHGHAGLGLFTIRERITLLGGEFEVDSAPGRGARFTLRVPRRRLAASGGSP